MLSSEFVIGKTNAPLKQTSEQRRGCLNRAGRCLARGRKWLKGGEWGVALSEQDGVPQQRARGGGFLNRGGGGVSTEAGLSEQKGGPEQERGLGECSNGV